jgi:hypothetical protein
MAKSKDSNLPAMLRNAEQAGQIQRFKSKFYFWLAVCMLHVTCYMLHVPAVNAQQAQISFDPPITYVATQPGKTLDVPINLENKGDPGTIKLKVRPFQVTDSFGHTEIKEGGELPVKFSLEQDNLNFNLDEAFFIKTNETKKIRLRIEVPSDLSEKDYYYSVLAELQAPPEQEGVTSTRIKVTVVSDVILTVTQSGALVNKGKILSFSATSPHSFMLGGKNIFDSSYPVHLSLLLENSGHNFIRPQGKVDLRGQFGAHASFELPTATVLAGTQRNLSLEVPGLYFGRYNVAATISLGEGAAVVFAQTSFIAFPFRLAFIVIAAIFLILVIRLRKKRKNK